MTAASYRKSLFVLLFVYACPFFVSAQKYGLSPEKGIRFNFGPGVGFYTINSKHAKSPYQKISVLAGFKKEWRMDREHRSFFLTGIDYLFHGLGFRSYYFLPDSLQLYDKSFAYDYSLYIHELHLPLQFKFLFRRKSNRAFSPYVQGAYHLRYLVTSDLRITQNGVKVKYDSPELKFKNPLINENLNSFASVSFGWQRNSTGASKGNFFVELNFRYGFSPYSFQRSYAPSSLYISSSHVLLLLGFKL